jgi:hypothetical protein
MAKITGNSDGPNGRNDTYQVGHRKDVPRETVVLEVKNGLHPDYHVVNRDGYEYIRDNPDSSKSDNVK